MAESKPPVFYRARGNEIVDSDGRQIAVVLPSGCTKKLAREMAAYAAQQANHAARQREHLSTSTRTQYEQ